MDRKFTKIFTSCNAVHSIAIDEAGVAYGWGRNESSQLGASLPNVVVLPTELELPDKVVGAALGKSHTILQLADQSLWAVGANKAGQCGVRVGTEVIPNFRKCVVPESVTIVQVRFLSCLLLWYNRMAHKGDSRFFRWILLFMTDFLWRRFFGRSRLRGLPLFDRLFGIRTTR
jgi:hypothetical protein